LDGVAKLVANSILDFVNVTKLISKILIRNEPV